MRVRIHVLCGVVLLLVAFVSLNAAVRHQVGRQGGDGNHPAPGPHGGGFGGVGVDIIFGSDPSKPASKVSRIAFDVYMWWYNADERYRAIRSGIEDAITAYKALPSPTAEQQQILASLQTALAAFPEPQPFADLRAGDFDTVFLSAPDQKELRDMLLKVDAYDKIALDALKSITPPVASGGSGPNTEGSALDIFDAAKLVNAVEVRNALKPEIVARRDLQAATKSQIAHVTVVTLGAGQTEVPGYGISYCRQRDQFFGPERTPVRGPSRTKVDVIAGAKVFYAKDPTSGTEKSQDGLVNHSPLEIDINVG
jgi:hypothetical protein